MASSGIYRDPIIGLIIGKLNTEGPQRLKNRWYHGDPIVPGKSGLPGGFISWSEFTANTADSVDDEHKMELIINVAIDITKDYGQSQDVTSGSSQLYDIMIGRDPDTLDLRSDSLAGFVMKYQHGLSNNVWFGVDTEEDLNIRFGIGNQKRGSGIFTLEGIMRVNVLRHEAKQSAN